MVGILGMLGRCPLFDLYFLRQLLYAHLIYVIPYKQTLPTCILLQKQKYIIHHVETILST
jgi:hypothetical protein